MLEEILDMVKILRLASNERHWKITGMEEDVKYMQDDYVELKKRVELIKASNDKGQLGGGACDRNGPPCKRNTPVEINTCHIHSEETDEALDEIQTCVDEVQDTLDIVLGFSHPCDGPGWHQVIYLDMNDPNTDCPGNWHEVVFDAGLSRRACAIRLFAELRTKSVTFQVNEEYSQVCGRVHGYSRSETSINDPGGFRYFYENNNSNITSPSDTDFFASGLTLYREIDDEHIWSFIAGTPSLNSISIEGCPCDTGENDFFDTFGDLPSFIGTDYFCETATSDKEVDTPLWDGLNCIDGSECCDYGTPPYFQRVLSPSYDNIVAKLSVEKNIFEADIAIYFMEIFVRL